MERLPVETTRQLLDAICVGQRRFAWLPTRLRGPGGWFGDGWTWLRPVILRRHIGFPSYYYMRCKPGSAGGPRGG